MLNENSIDIEEYVKDGLASIHGNIPEDSPLNFVLSQKIVLSSKPRYNLLNPYKNCRNGQKKRSQKSCD
jgi:hypothetical protein